MKAHGLLLTVFLFHFFYVFTSVHRALRVPTEGVSVLVQPVKPKRAWEGRTINQGLKCGNRHQLEARDQSTPGWTAKEFEISAVLN